MDSMGKVIIYTTPACVYCLMTKIFFKKHDIAYDEKDVSIDEHALHEMVEKSGQMGVPVIEIGDAIVIGFDQELLTELLGIKKEGE